MLPPRAENDYTDRGWARFRETQQMARSGKRALQARQGAAALALFGALGVSCGRPPLEASFAAGWEPGDGADGRAALAALAGKATTQSLPVVVGVTGRGLVGRALPGGELWRYEGAVDVLPSLVGDVVAFTAGGELRVLDGRTGALRFALPVSGRRLEGVGGDGAHLVFLLVDSDDARPDQLLVTSGVGEVLHSATTLERLGTPAALGGLGLVPFARQYVSVFDLTTGKPVGRLLVRDDLHTVTAAEDGLWLLGRGALHLDEQLLASAEPTSLRLSVGELPGEPRWPRDGSKPRPARARPIDVWAEPRFEAGRVTLAGEAYAFSYYDLVVGFARASGRVRWTSAFDRAVVGGAPGPEGPSVCLEDGSVWRLRWRDGARAESSGLSARLKACVLTSERTPIAGPDGPPLEEQVQATLAGTGPELAAVHELLVRDLAERGGAPATGALLAVARDPLATPSLSALAGELLRHRREGAELMIAALLDSAPAPAGEATGASGAGVSSATDAPPEDESPRTESEARVLRAPPVDALAEALSGANATGAAPALAAHLAEPSIAGGSALALVHSLHVLGGPAEVPAVRAFFDTYENAGGDAEFIAALGLAAEFMVRHGNEADRQLVRDARDGHLTHPLLKEQLAALRLGDPPAEGASGSDGKAAPQGASTGAKPPKGR
jgi:hypothetical protein